MRVFKIMNIFLMRKFSLILCIIGLLLTFLIAGNLIYEGGEIKSISIKLAYNLVFFSSVSAIILNIFNAIFKKSVLNSSPKIFWIAILIVFDIIIFQAFPIIGFSSAHNFTYLYKKHFILLQMINLIFLWMIICGLYGQDNFSPFWKQLFRNPLGAIGYLVGYFVVRRK